MKKSLAILCIAALLAGLCGCGPFVSLMPGTDTPESLAAEAAEEAASFVEKPLFEFLGWEDFGASYYTDTPVALSFAGPDGWYSPVFDRVSIIKACDALRGMTVTGEAGASDGSADSSFRFTMADGRTYTVSFAAGLLDRNSGSYTVSGGDELWDLTFPCVSGSYGVFDLYASDAVTAFAANFDTDTPVSVGRRQNGGALLTSTDAAVVRQVFDGLRGLALQSVESSPDQNIDLNQTTDYVFTMADGTTRTFSFSGSCLCVQANAAYGSVYYWADGVDALFAVSVLPEDDSGAFTGGAVTGLRDDMQEASEAANGSIEGKNVIGVYVSYVINGNEGIVTLQNDEAAAFTRSLSELQVTGETLEGVPDGELITVSVTLADWSGPIYYFNGGYIQQSVGLWFRCDESSFASLQSRILDEAATHETPETGGDVEETDAAEG